MSNYQELKEKMAVLAQEKVAAAKEYFKEESKKFFDKYSMLENFGWTQYTDFFNDGELQFS